MSERKSVCERDLRETERERVREVADRQARVVCVCVTGQKTIKKKTNKTQTIQKKTQKQVKQQTEKNAQTQQHANTRL